MCSKGYGAQRGNPENTRDENLKLDFQRCLGNPEVHSKGGKGRKRSGLGKKEKEGEWEKEGANKGKEGKEGEEEKEEERTGRKPK